MFEDQLLLKQLQLETDQVAYIRKMLLRDYPEFVGRRLSFKDLYQLAELLPYREADDLDATIFAVFAIKCENRYDSLVIAANGIYRLRYSPKQLIARLVYHTSYVRHHKTVCKVIAQVFRQKSLWYLPYVSSSFALMPLGPGNKASTCWVNPACLSRYLTDASESYLEYSFGLDHREQPQIPQDRQ